MPSGSQPSVSVIIPVFNGARYIRDAVEARWTKHSRTWESLLSMTARQMTQRFLSDLVSGGKIQYIYHENRGLSAARNTGINSAKVDILNSWMAMIFFIRTRSGSSLSK